MSYFLCLLFLIIHESGLGDKENWEDTNALVKNFLPEIKFDLSHEYVVVILFFIWGNFCFSVVFLLFWGMVMYTKEVETKDK